MTVEELRELIPNFDERCLLVYQRWRYAMIQKYVPRMGYVKFGVYGLENTASGLLSPETPISDSDHIFALVVLVRIYEDVFGKFYPRLFMYQPDWCNVMAGLINHELGEIEIGDLTDDGTYNKVEKDRIETKVFDDYMRGFDADVQRARKAEFSEVQNGKDIKKLFDKVVFVLAQGFLKHHFNLEGSMDYKGQNFYLSNQDRRYVEATGSTRPVDNLFAHFLDISRDLTVSRGFFIGIIEAMYREDYGGKIPDGVKRFY